MRITYTRDHFQRAYIIQIVLDDDQMEGLPLSINLQPSMFMKLSAQLRLLATVAETLEAAPIEEDSTMAMADLDEENMEETEEEYDEEQEEEDTGIPDEEPEEEDFEELELEEEELPEEEEEDSEDEEKVG